MKKYLLILAMISFAHLSFAVAIDRITSTSIRFYNYSQSNFDMTGMHLTINNSVYVIDSLHIKKSSNPYEIAPGHRIEFDGLTLPAAASIALWYPNAFPNNQNAGNIASFMQYGSAGNPYEVIAVQAGLWVTGEFVPGTPPFIRDGDYFTFGAGNWGAGLSQTELEKEKPQAIYPNPFSNRLIVSDLNSGITYAEIINGQGKICIQANGNNKKEIEINTENLKNGIYLFRFQLENGQVFNRQLLKQ